MVEHDIAGAICSSLASVLRGRGISPAQIHVHKSHSLATHTYIHTEGEREINYYTFFF